MKYQTQFFCHYQTARPNYNTLEETDKKLIQACVIMLQKIEPDWLREVIDS